MKIAVFWYMTPCSYIISYRHFERPYGLRYPSWYSWTVRGSKPGGGEIFRNRPDRPWSPPSLLNNWYRGFPGGKAAGAWRIPLLSNAEVKERVEQYLYSPLLGLRGPFKNNLNLYLRNALLFPTSGQSKTNMLLQSLEYREDGRLKLLRNASNKLQTNMASYDRKLQW
jgi:hypothetical protein